MPILIIGITTKGLVAVSKARLKSLAIFSIIISLLAPSFTSTIARPSQKFSHKQKPIPAILNYKPGEVLVKFKEKASSSQQESISKRAGGQTIIEDLELGKKGSVKLLRLKDNVSVKSAEKKLENEKLVEYAEPNYLAKLSYTPNDTSFSSQWAFDNTGQIIGGVTGTPDADIDAKEAWDIEDGSSNPVTVAIIDSGIDTNHPDLANKMWQNTDEIAGDGLDNDSNGYIDDVNGYNFAGISQYAANQFWDFGKNDTYEIAQSIKGTGRPLTHIGILLSKVGSPSGNVTVSVRQTLGGADLASYTLTPSDILTHPSYDEEYKALSSSVTLTNGTTYYIVFRTSVANASNYYLVADNYSGAAYYENDPYKDGLEYWFNGASWDSYASDDFYFSTNPNANPRDDNGHGTHVGGIVGAQTNNATGVAGTSPGAKLMALKAGDSSGSLYTSDIIEAINYAAANGAKVINMSFGGTGNSASQQQAETNAYNAGVTLFASAGNSGDSTMQYPAGHANVIGVGSTTNQDAKSSFSTYNSSVDISAPGSQIYSTMPTYAVAINAQNYAYLSGTSMASPMAAGVAALVKSNNPALTPAQVESVMEQYSDDLGSAGRDDYFGYGRVNANRTLLSLNDTTPPTNPAISSSTHPYSSRYYSNNDPAFSWSTSDASGIAGYSYILNRSSSTTPDNIVDSSSTGKKYYNIRSGIAYFHVRATDIVGNWGAASHRRIIIDTYRPRTYAPYKRKIRRGRYTRLYWKAYDPYTGNRAAITIKIQKRVGRRYYTKKTVRYGWTSINRLRYYLQKFNYPGTYRFLVYARDKAGNRQYNIARNYVVVY